MAEHNQACAQYCVDVVRAVMKEQPVPPMPDTVTLGELYAFSKAHCVEAMVFHGVSQLDIDAQDPVVINWENRTQMILTQSIVQLAERDTLFDALQDAGIEALPVKGCWLKEGYPQIDYRQMSDMDVLIHFEDRERAAGVMKALGYTPEVVENPIHHDGYEKKPYAAVELHLQLLPKEDPHCSYYDDVWDKPGPVDGYSFIRRFTPEDEYIYYFLHMKKHMETAGCGIRLLLDCPVYRSLYPDWNRAYLEQEFSRLGILEYVLQVEKLSDCWFVTGEELPQPLEEMAESVLRSSAYGSLDTFFERRVEVLKKKHKNPLVLQVVYWWSRFFLPLKEMKIAYPVLNKAPFLLPVCWVIRMVYKLFHHPRALMYHVKKVFNEGMKRDES